MKERWVCFEVAAPLLGTGLRSLGRRQNAALWAYLCGAAPTGQRLARNQSIASDVCPLCGQAGDDLMHGLFRCPVAPKSVHDVVGEDDVDLFREFEQDEPKASCLQLGWVPRPAHAGVPLEAHLRYWVRHGDGQDLVEVTSDEFSQFGPSRPVYVDGPCVHPTFRW